MANNTDDACFSDVGKLAETLIERTGGNIRLALPLGLGKANTIANALTRAACDNPNIRLSILTALTLQRPKPGSELEKRLLDPAADRLFGAYQPLLYAELIKQGELPENIEVSEFFLQTGNWLGNEYAQRHYVAANYTYAFDTLLNFRPNVVAQLVALDERGQVSLSGNTDITVDLLKARREGETDFIFAAEINSNLPFMGRSAIVDADDLDFTLEPPGDHFELFSLVRRPVALEHLAIGLHASRLVPDGGTLQIGIGSIGDAIAQSLLLREQKNDTYRALVADCPFGTAPPESHEMPFDEGLYCVTEMLVGGILELFKSGIIRREVDGAAIHAGFFLDCRDFYEQLSSMPAEKRDKIAMMPVSFTNALYGDEPQKRAARKNARFINNAMIVTCLGAVASDMVPDGQVVSGIGGQFNFVEQAFALKDGRAIITINATRESGGKTVSNIKWNYEYLSVPRPYRDIVVTEYGVADLKGKTDEACIMAMLSVADSRFQEGLRRQAVKAGKLSRDYEIPVQYRSNLPETLKSWLEPARRNHTLPAYPFGTDFTPVEQRLLPALSHLKQAQSSYRKLAGLVWRGMASSAQDRAALERMRLDKVGCPKDRLFRYLVAGALAETTD
ncbi:acetyl-CoA hydrolase/transferase C-terminal domain-containing protein [Rhizobium sp. L1K21]|uniref:acetyl-CoA hydrolase/transferase C-terminal domain-containing protein n=1 Tax=Rhizobium sp. L1K21 TaxID=2954933 RepID=UPI002093EE50|nr:acetyl-CoA hydrolase/transferase C-terminal domain-containing protein [Rhizobium sp. L1K21]MCO6187729.1 hypothetical protein [Rhizobium sp. L1K21]